MQTYKKNMQYKLNIAYTDVFQRHEYFGISDDGRLILPKTGACSPLYVRMFIFHHFTISLRLIIFLLFGFRMFRIYTSG
jgi:hypothetical protein